MKRALASAFTIILGGLLVLCIPSCDKDNNNTTAPETDNPETQTDKDKPTTPFKLAPVDLGLSVKWANANLGATSETDPGYYYAWGETEPNKNNYTLDTYKFYDKETGKYTKYVNERNPFQADEGTPDHRTQLELSDDAAHVVLGEPWRMPTKKECDELKNTKKNPDYTWEPFSTGDYSAVRITYKKTQAYIIIVDGGNMKEYYENSCFARGNYRIWTSSFVVQKGLSGFAYKLSGDNDTADPRELGFNIRPVCP